MNSLPPRVPEAMGELERAIELLGGRAKGDELCKKARLELLGLIGAYPGAAQAALWKRELKQLRVELLGDGSPAGD